VKNGREIKRRKETKEKKLN